MPTIAVYVPAALFRELAAKMGLDAKENEKAVEEEVRTETMRALERRVGWQNK